MRIDVYHRALVPEWRRAMEVAGADKPGGAALPDRSAEAALAALDSAQVDASVLSLSEPGVFQGEAVATDLARRCNGATARVIASDPRRLGALAVLPLRDVPGELLGATAEGARAAAVGGSARRPFPRLAARLEGGDKGG